MGILLFIYPIEIKRSAYIESQQMLNVNTIKPVIAIKTNNNRIKSYLTQQITTV